MLARLAEFIPSFHVFGRITRRLAQVRIGREAHCWRTIAGGRPMEGPYLCARPPPSTGGLETTPLFLGFVFSLSGENLNF